MDDWNDAEQRVERAEELFNQQKWEDALKELRAATEVNPYNPSWHFNIGLTLDELQRYPEAIEAYQQAIELDPNDLYSMNHMGVDQHRTGKYAIALKTFERMEAIDASFEPSYCNRIITYTELGEHDRAEEMFYLARLCREHCPHCYYNIGCSLFDRGLYDKALFCWQKTLDLDDEHPEVNIRMAEALWAKGELEPARQQYLTGLRLDPGDTETLLDLGELLVEMGRESEAGEKFRRALETSPELAGCHYCYGVWLLDRGHIGPSQRAFAHALKLDPTFQGVHLHLAEIAWMEKDRLLTRRELRKEIRLHPTDPGVLMELSNLLLDVGLTRPAVACLRRLTQIDEKDAEAWQNLAVALFQRRDYTEGIACSLKALELAPDNLETIYNLALAHQQAGELNLSLQWVRKGQALSPNDTSFARLGFRSRLLRGKAMLMRSVRRIFLRA